MHSFTCVAFLGRPVTNYADSFVRELLYAKERQEQLAAPGAMVVLNIWMQVIQKVSYSSTPAYQFLHFDLTIFRVVHFR
jgi:hypothetical protein